MSRNASKSGKFFPRHIAPMHAVGKSFNGSARTLGENLFLGTATESPIPMPLATYVSIKSTELASTVGNHSTPISAKRA